ncbi:hypothetical protein GJ496_000730 [Pomphorhynchus laevis]|nr:hypothetical protein GJ496_000730 [Pomphorhynchus laevis]
MNNNIIYVYDSSQYTNDLTDMLSSSCSLSLQIQNEIAYIEVDCKYYKASISTQFIHLDDFLQKYEQLYDQNNDLVLIANLSCVSEEIVRCLELFYDSIVVSRTAFNDSDFAKGNNVLLLDRNVDEIAEEVCNFLLCYNWPSMQRKINRCSESNMHMNSLEFEQILSTAKEFRAISNTMSDDDRRLGAELVLKSMLGTALDDIDSLSD